MKNIAFVICHLSFVIFFTGCATNPNLNAHQQRTLDFLQAAVIGAADASAQNLLSQTQNGQVSKVDTASLSGAAISGAIYAAAQQLRALQSTPQAASPSAVKTALASAGPAALTGPIATTTAAGIQTAVALNVPPDQANEAAAQALDKAAATLGK